MAHLMGPRELRKMDVHACIVEGDSTNVVGWGLGKGGGSWKLAHILYEIRELSCILRVYYMHVLRTQNRLAYKLVNRGRVCLPFSLVLIFWMWSCNNF